MNDDERLAELEYQFKLYQKIDYELQNEVAANIFLQVNGWLSKSFGKETFQDTIDKTLLFVTKLLQEQVNKHGK